MINRKLIAVERAAAELRRGASVIIGNGENSLLITSAELITENRLDQFKSASDSPPLIALTYNRANILKISPRSGNVALVELSDHMNSGIISAMADPADDLMNILQGPFHVAEDAPNELHEASIKLCKIARLLPAAVIVEFSRSSDDNITDNQILTVSADDILSYDINDAISLDIITSAKVPLAGAENATVVAFRPADGGTEHFAILIGNPSQTEPVLTRIHSECFTGDLLGSLKCDCGEQLRGAIKFMNEQGGGILLYLAQEGRGIGLINKLRAYHLQDQGFDTVDANERLGFLADERIFEPAAQMLKKMGYKTVRLLTNNPDKVKGLQDCGITVSERVEHKFPSNNHNDFYLKTKKKRSGHLL